MAKAARATCDRCDRRVHNGAPYCKKCGRPTVWATHDQRVRWELHEYRDRVENNPMGVLYEPSPRRGTGSTPARVPLLFGRRAHREHAAPTVAVKPPGPVARAVDPVPAAERPQAQRLMPRPTRSKKDEEPLRDTPATVLAVRMLNERVSELDSTIQKLRKEIEILRRG
jgi:hypothetical protein